MEEIFTEKMKESHIKSELNTSDLKDQIKKF